MAVPFQCACGSSRCAGWIAGAATADPAALEGHVLAGGPSSIGARAGLARSKARPWSPRSLSARPPRMPATAAGALIAIGLVIDSAYYAVLPLNFKLLIDEALGEGREELLAIVLRGVPAAVVFASAVGIWRDRLYARLSALVTNDLRRALFARLQRLGLDFYARMGSGEILGRFSTDLAAVETALVEQPSEPRHLRAVAGHQHRAARRARVAAGAAPSSACRGASSGRGSSTRAPTRAPTPWARAGPRARPRRGERAHPAGDQGVRPRRPAARGLRRASCGASWTPVCASASGARSSCARRSWARRSSSSPSSPTAPTSRWTARSPSGRWRRPSRCWRT